MMLGSLSRKQHLNLIRNPITQVSQHLPPASSLFYHPNRSHLPTSIMRLFLICLLLMCILHSRHSLPTPQTLHKRMLSLGKQANALVRRGLRVADPATEVLRQSPRVRFAPDESLNQVCEYDPNLNPAETVVTSPEDLHPTIRDPSDIAPAPLKGILRTPSPPTNHPYNEVLVRVSKVVRQKLSGAVARNMEFLRRARSKKPVYRKINYESEITGPGPFENPFKQETNPLHPLLKTTNPVLEVDNFFKELEMTSTQQETMAGAGSNLSSLKQEYFKNSPAINSKTRKQLKNELRTQLNELNVLLKDESELEEKVAEGMELMTKNIQDILSTTGDYAIPNLVYKMSDYKFTVLLKDQKRIKSYLPKDQNYLTQLIGLLGPKNVLAPVLDEAIRSNDLMGEAKWLSTLPEDFISKVKGIQEELGKLVFFNQENELKTALESTTVLKDKPDPNIMTTIEELEKQMIEDFGGHGNLKIALDNIESWDMHKWLMQEMDNPYSMHGLLLQLIEPWGYMRQYYKIPKAERPYMEWGVENERGKHNLKILDTHASDLALHIIQAQLEIAADLRRVEANINGILTPEGIKAFTNSLKKQT